MHNPVYATSFCDTGHPRQVTPAHGRAANTRQLLSDNRPPTFAAPALLHWNALVAGALVAASHRAEGCFFLRAC